MSLPSENSGEEQGATEGQGRAGRMCTGKMSKKEMEEWLVKAPEKTGRCAMEEEFSCSVGEVLLHG